MEKIKNANFRKLAIYFVMVAIIILFGILSPTFLTLANLITILRQISMLGIVAVGMMFVALTGCIDLSVGAQMSFAGIVASMLVVNSGWSIVSSCVAAIALCVIIGVLNGLIVTKTGMTPMIATLGIMTALEGLTFIISGGYPIYGLPSAFKVLGQGNLGVIPVPVIVMVAIIAFGGFVLNRTYLGRHFYAVGSNEEASRLAGIDPSKIRIIGYALCGLFAGIAGVIMLSRVNSGQPNAGKDYEMDAITAIVLGGISINGGVGKITGVIIGSLIIGILNNGLVLVGLNDYWQKLIMGLVLILAVSFDMLQQKRAAKVKAR